MKNQKQTTKNQKQIKNTPKQKSNWLKRAATGFTLGPIFCLSTVYAPKIFQILGSVVILFSLLEFESMSYAMVTTNIGGENRITERFRKYFRWLYLLTGMSIPIITILTENYFYTFISLVSSFTLLMIGNISAAYFSQDNGINFQRFAYFLSLFIGIFWTSFMLNSQLILDQLNPQLAFISLLTPLLSDIFAMIIGRNFGKHCLYRDLSPNKTWEGFFGGVFLGPLVPLLFLLFVRTLPFAVCARLLPTDCFARAPGFFLATLGGSFFTQIGDLCQSYFKRISRVKDSSVGGVELFPGHGGAIDRICGIIFASTYMLIIHVCLSKTKS